MRQAPAVYEFLSVTAVRPKKNVLNYFMCESPRQSMNSYFLKTLFFSPTEREGQVCVWQSRSPFPPEIRSEGNNSSLSARPAD